MFPTTTINASALEAARELQLSEAVARCRADVSLHPQLAITSHLAPHSRAISAIILDAAACAGQSAHAAWITAQAADPILDGAPNAHLACALRDLAKTNELPTHLLDSLTLAAKLQPGATAPQTWQASLDLCSSLAAAQSLAAIALALHDEGDRPAEVEESLEALAALNTTFWQGITLAHRLAGLGADVRRNHFYFPVTEFGAEPHELTSWLATPTNPHARRRFRDDLKAMTRRAVMLLECAAPFPALVAERIDGVPGSRAGWHLWQLRRTALQLLQRIAHDQYVTLWESPRVPAASRAFLRARSTLSALLRSRPPIDRPAAIDN